MSPVTRKARLLPVNFEYHQEKEWQRTPLKKL